MARYSWRKVSRDRDLYIEESDEDTVAFWLDRNRNQSLITTGETALDALIALAELFEILAYEARVAATQGFAFGSALIPTVRGRS